MIRLADIVSTTEKAAAECISDDALIHLKSYKYSSVDKSPVSKYILGPWVRGDPFFIFPGGVVMVARHFSMSLLCTAWGSCAKLSHIDVSKLTVDSVVVECIRKRFAVMDRAEYGHPVGFLFYPG